MRTKYKTNTLRYRTKLRKPADLNKAVITSSYKLSDVELEELKSQFPQLKNLEIENAIDTKLIAGIIIRIGTKRIDLSLASGLYSLKKYLYEHS